MQDRPRLGFLGDMRRALVLRGEEKSDPKELDIARNELARKFGTWNPTFYGQAIKVTFHTEFCMEAGHVMQPAYFFLVVCSLLQATQPLPRHYQDVA